MPGRFIRRARLAVLASLLAAVLGGAGRTDAQYLGPPDPVAPPLPVPAEAVSPEPAPVAPPGALPPRQDAVPEWSARRLRIWGALGAAFSNGQSAVSLDVGVGYFVWGGLLPTLDVGVTLGSGPVVFLVKPGLDWFLPVPGGVVPFLGGYYAHWFVPEGYLPQDAWGARAGVSLGRLGPATLLLGVAYEQVFTNCTGSCGHWIPQVAAGFAL
jgi:hypothetical protein